MPRPPRHVLLAALAGSIVVALTACASTPTGLPDYFCTPSIGNYPDFELAGGDPSYDAVKPGASGVTVVTVPIAMVKDGPFDFVVWDVLDLVGYLQPPDTMQYTVDTNPTVGTATTFVSINVYAWTPVGDYGLKLRGLAYTGSFFEGASTVVGECFRPFVLSVRN
jgi:hypothetical protein